MLKIAVHTLGRVMLFTLEGKLAGPWVNELEFCWRSVVGMPPINPARVDLSSVTFIDSEGKHLLSRMHREGAELVTTGCLNKCIVEEITREAKQPQGGGS